VEVLHRAACGRIAVVGARCSRAGALASSALSPSIGHQLAYPAFGCLIVAQALPGPASTTRFAPGCDCKGSPSSRGTMWTNKTSNPKRALSNLLERDRLFEGAPRLPEQPEGIGAPPMPTYVSEFLATIDGLALTKAFMELKGAKPAPTHRRAPRSDGGRRIELRLRDSLPGAVPPFCVTDLQRKNWRAKARPCWLSPYLRRAADVAFNDLRPLLRGRSGRGERDGGLLPARSPEGPRPNQVCAVESGRDRPEWVWTMKTIPVLANRRHGSVTLRGKATSVIATTTRCSPRATLH